MKTLFKILLLSCFGWAPLANAERTAHVFVVVEVTVEEPDGFRTTTEHWLRALTLEGIQQIEGYSPLQLSVFGSALLGMIPIDWALDVAGSGPKAGESKEDYKARVDRYKKDPNSKLEIRILGYRLSETVEDQPVKESSHRISRQQYIKLRPINIARLFRYWALAHFAKNNFRFKDGEDRAVDFSIAFIEKDEPTLEKIGEGGSLRNVRSAETLETLTPEEFAFITLTPLDGEIPNEGGIITEGDMIEWRPVTFRVDGGIGFGLVGEIDGKTILFAEAFPKGVEIGQEGQSHDGKVTEVVHLPERDKTVSTPFIRHNFNEALRFAEERVAEMRREAETARRLREGETRPKK